MVRSTEVRYRNIGHGGNAVMDLDFIFFLFFWWFCFCFRFFATCTYCRLMCRGLLPLCGNYRRVGTELGGHFMFALPGVVLHKTRDVEGHNKHTSIE